MADLIAFLDHIQLNMTQKGAHLTRILDAHYVFTRLGHGLIAVPEVRAAVHPAKGLPGPTHHMGMGGDFAVYHYLAGGVMHDEDHALARLQVQGKLQGIQFADFGKIPAVEIFQGGLVYGGAADVDRVFNFRHARVHIHIALDAQGHGVQTAAAGVLAEQQNLIFPGTQLHRDALAQHVGPGFS